VSQELHTIQEWFALPMSSEKYQEEEEARGEEVLTAKWKGGRRGIGEGWQIQLQVSVHFLQS